MFSSTQLQRLQAVNNPVIRALTQALQNYQQLPAVPTKTFSDIRDTYKDFREKWNSLRRTHTFLSHFPLINLSESFDAFLLRCGSFLSSPEFPILLEMILYNEPDKWKNSITEDAALGYLRGLACAFALYLISHGDSILHGKITGIALSADNAFDTLSKNNSGPYFTVALKNDDGKTSVVDLRSHAIMGFEQACILEGVYLDESLKDASETLGEKYREASSSGNPPPSYMFLDIDESKFDVKKTGEGSEPTHSPDNKFFVLSDRTKETISALKSSYELRSGFASYVISSPHADSAFEDIMIQKEDDFNGDYNKAFSATIADIARDPETWNVTVRKPN